MISSYPPALGGAQLHAHRLNRELLTRDHDVHVATIWRSARTDWMRGTSFFSPGRRETDSYEGISVSNLGLSFLERARVAIPGLLFYPASLLPSVVPIGGASLARAFADQAGKVIRTFRPDVAHLSRIGREWYYQAFIDVLRRDEIPVVLTPNHHLQWNRRRDDWWWSIYRQADAVIALTRYEAERLIRGGIDSKRVVVGSIGPVGPVPPEASRMEVSSTEPTVMFLGQVRKYKGVGLLYSAMKWVWEEMPSARLIVVGPWLDRQRVLQRRLSSDPRVAVYGPVSENAKWDALNSARVLCVPSKHEALGGVYIEAWSMGRPCVALDTPAVRELFESTGAGFLSSPDSRALASSLLPLLESRSMAQAMGSKGEIAVQTRYSWAHAANRAEHAYHLAASR